MKITVICRKNVNYKNGTAPLFIRFTHNRTSKLVSLGIAIPSECWDMEQQAVTADCPNGRTVQVEIDSKLREYQKKVQRLEALDIEVSLDTLFETNGKRVNCTLDEFFGTVIGRMESIEKHGTASKYGATLSILRQFRPSARFADIDNRFLQDFEVFMRQRGNKDNYIATNMSVLKAVYNKAIAESVFVVSDNPFLRYKVGSLWKKTRKRAIVKEDIHKLVSLSIPENERTAFTELAKDIFLFSYFMAGINFKDIASLRYGDIYNGRIYYKRNKTGKEMNCPLIEQAQAIIEKYKRADYADNDYIFPILDKSIHQSEQQIINRVHKVLGRVNRELRSFGKKIGLSIPLTTYVARHSFATVLKRLLQIQE